ncbi:uncharacterized protein LOC117330912 isoform X1 [Pecten maximus]|uniref:uncharacterized protein LOC117330912 isoform X1 n=1 Tax=Pecten maximus TaxID=6579 RepID=UPI0014590E99|nr:uncharacterized protein LOC117330912 isoform X1 [Pecten maximus]
METTDRGLGLEGSQRSKEVTEQDTNMETTDGGLGLEGSQHSKEVTEQDTNMETTDRGLGLEGSQHSKAETEMKDSTIESHLKPGESLAMANIRKMKMVFAKFKALNEWTLVGKSKQHESSDFDDSDNDPDYVPPSPNKSSKFDDSDNDSDYVPPSPNKTSKLEDSNNDPDNVPPSPNKTSKFNVTIKYEEKEESSCIKKRSYRQMATKRQRASKPRKRKLCDQCPISVVNLARHLRVKHGYNKDGSKSRVREIKIQRNTKQRRYKDCPIQGCVSQVKRLDAHLQHVHNLAPDVASREAKKAVFSDEKEDNLQDTHDLFVTNKQKGIRTTVIPRQRKPDLHSWQSNQRQNYQ